MILVHERRACELSQPGSSTMAKPQAAANDSDRLVGSFFCYMKSASTEIRVKKKMQPRLPQTGTDAERLANMQLVDEQEGAPGNVP